MGRIARAATRYQELIWRMARCAAVSIVAAVVSEVVFLASYGPLGAGPRLASVLAFLAGAVPNYVLNRRWVWRASGQVRIGRELAPYLAVSLGTGLLAIALTSAADAAVRHSALPPTARALAVGAAYLATYGVMFVVKFALFDRVVFASAATGAGAAGAEATPARRPEALATAGDEAA